VNLSSGVVAKIARYWPFANGAGRIVDRFGDGIACGSGVRTAVTKDGFSMQVMASDLIGRHLLITGQFDRSLFEILVRCGQLGDRVLDVGGNIGYASCLALKHIPESRVVAIEPQAEVAALLRQNLGQFGDGRWRVEQVALSDHDGEGHMTIEDDNRGGSALGDSGVAVRLVNADAFLQTFDRLDLIKVDIEGHEETLFRAGAAQIARLQPRAILYEDTAHLPGAAGWIDEILDRAGYEVFGVRKSLLATRLVRVDATNRTDFHDYLAVSRVRAREIAWLQSLTT
jgi:FkbM family methyltransferase